MANVLLIVPTGEEDAAISSFAGPHCGSHRIAGYLRKFGHDVTVWDQWYDSLRLEEVLAAKDWNLIGFSPLSHTLPQDIMAMQTSHRLCPRAKIVAGGMEAALNFQEIFDHTDVNAVILAEGEEPMRALSDMADSGVYREVSAIPGIIWRERAKPITGGDLWNYYQCMDFSSMNYPLYWARIRELTGNQQYEPDIRLVTETHCNRNCIFCSQTNFHRRAIGRTIAPAMLTAEQIYDIICRAKRDLPELKRVKFDGDDFFMDRQRALTFFRDYAQREPLSGFKYLVEAGIPTVDEKLVFAGAMSGLVFLNMGLENCSQRVLKALGKPQDVEKTIQIISWCRKYRVEPYLLILLFAPESTIEDLRLNADMLTEFMESGAALGISPNIRPYRGTRLYEMDYDFEWRSVPLAGGGTLKQAYIAWCRDPEARAIQEAFWEAWPSRLRQIKELEGHAYSRRIAPEILHLLKELLSTTPGAKAQNGDYSPTSPCPKAGISRRS